VRSGRPSRTHGSRRCRFSRLLAERWRSGSQARTRAAPFQLPTTIKFMSAANTCCSAVAPRMIA